MKHLKHTPGPWKFINGEITGYENGKLMYVCSVENRANAQLIAEAPDMHAALEEVRDSLLTALKYGPDTCTARQLCIQDALAAAIKVLAKLEEGT